MQLSAVNKTSASPLLGFGEHHTRSGERTEELEGGGVLYKDVFWS